MRFIDHLGVVYRAGPPHLYLIRKDGSSLRQLTSGNYADVHPSLSDDGKRVLFERTRSYDDGWPSPPYRLFSIALHGAPLGKPHTIGAARNEDEKADDSTVDALRNRFTAATRLDSRTFIAFDRKYSEDQPQRADPFTLVLVNRQGEILKRQTFKTRRVPDYEDTLSDDIDVDRLRAFRLQKPGVILWQARHPMSDGGYDFTWLFDMNAGVARSLGEQTIEDVSRRRTAFVGSAESWVGGYKGAGAAKLSTLYLWDARTLIRRPLGFRRMICFGACFVPARPLQF
jgi:hypothetical protein